MACASYGCSIVDDQNECDAVCAIPCTKYSNSVTINISMTYNNVTGNSSRSVSNGYYCSQTKNLTFDCEYTDASGFTVWESCPFNMSCSSSGCSLQLIKQAAMLGVEFSANNRNRLKTSSSTRSTNRPSTARILGRLIVGTSASSDSTTPARSTSPTPLSSTAPISKTISSTTNFAPHN